MPISVFVSHPQPHMKRQQEFLERVCDHLRDRDLDSRTLGRTDYGIHEPLATIRALLMDCNGVLTIAFRRSLVKEGEDRPASELPVKTKNELNGVWLTSPFCHIETAMAYQLGLPILVLVEQGVLRDGVLERGIAGIYVPEFDLDAPLDDYFAHPQWRHMVNQWEGYVRQVVNAKGQPPRLFTP